ncbi:MAG: hypothetical protein LBG22_00480 [Treponema sp.]|jgi:uncharacterized protein (DUF608 family)|nr:hypothetical protein [Treponema sp.]
MKKLNEKAGTIRFLLGGIGTGNISLDQNARYTDFELWNYPNKGFRSPYTFFAVRAQTPDGKIYTKALESRLVPPFSHGHGCPVQDLGGLSRFRHSEMTGNFPFVNYILTDEGMPLEVELEAFTPLIPLNTDDSSLPVAVLRYSVRNTLNTPLDVSVAGSFCNLSALTGKNQRSRKYTFGPSLNKHVETDQFRGIHFLPGDKTEKDLEYFEMALITTEKSKISYLEKWAEGAWLDGLQDFWNDFTADGELTPGRPLRGEGNTLVRNTAPIGSLCVKKNIRAGEKAKFEFILSWYQPNRIRSWNINQLVSDEHPIIRNYYAKFGPALESASYLVTNLKRLEDESRKFVRALSSGTLPDYVTEAVSATMTVIRSNTCFRVEDGTFFAWEGCNDTSGSCYGNCTHVLNYTQTMAFLFPDLEQSMRKTEFLYETENDGRQYFRSHHYMQDSPHSMPPAADGQLGTIIRLYRDWKLCGDDAFIRKMWPKAKLALEYAFTYWDKDGDGLLEGQQHNTYDIEFYGITSMINSIYFAALRAGEEISLYLDDKESAEKYQMIRIKGAQKLEALTFNGEYYEQNLEDINRYKYQYGKGCLADQLLGQQLAHVSGLGYLMDKEHIKSAVRSIFIYNFMRDFSDFNNIQRTYALNDDSGLLICTWPRGDRPEIPFVYCDEVWTGIEYQVASHLIYEGFVEEGLKITEAVRARHDGVERNPWNEVECGHHYARSLASYGVLLALTGFRCDGVNKKLYFKPAVNRDFFSAFFCCPAGWGLFHQRIENGKTTATIETLYGNLDAYEVITE